MATSLPKTITVSATAETKRYPIALPTLKNYMNNPQQGGLIYYGCSLHLARFYLMFFLRNSNFIDCVRELPVWSMSAYRCYSNYLGFQIRLVPYFNVWSNRSLFGIVVNIVRHVLVTFNALITIRHNVRSIVTARVRNYLL